MQRIHALVLGSALLGSGCEEPDAPPPRVVTQDLGPGSQEAGSGKPVSSAVVARIFEGDACVLIEPARTASVLGLDPDTVVFVHPVQQGPRKSCRYSWFDEVGGPSFSFGFDTLLQGETEEVAKQRASMERRSKRFEAIDVPGLAAYWDAPKNTLYWFPAEGHQLTVHMGQSNLDDRKSAAAGLITTFLAAE